LLYNLVLEEVIGYFPANSRALSSSRLVDAANRFSVSKRQICAAANEVRYAVSMASTDSGAAPPGPVRVLTIAAGSIASATI
jgi:hypothetical protein